MAGTGARLCGPRPSSRRRKGPSDVATGRSSGVAIVASCGGVEGRGCPAESALRRRGCWAIVGTIVGAIVGAIVGVMVGTSWAVVII